MSYKANLEQLSISPTGKVASAVQADSATTATTATTATSATTAVTATTATTASTVADNSITTTKIVNQAVTSGKTASATQAVTDIGNGLVFAGTAYDASSVKTVSISCSGNRPILIYFQSRAGQAGSFRCDSTRTNDSYVMELKRNGVVLRYSYIWQRTASAIIDWEFSPSLVWFIDQNPPSGTNTYAVNCATTADDGDLFYRSMNLVAMEI